MTLSAIGQIFVSGLVSGAIYAHIAISFALVYRSSRAINFAQGDLAMLGGYVAFSFLTWYQLPYAVAALIAVVAIGALSAVLEIVAFRSLYKHGVVYVIVSSIALGFVLETIMLLGWGAQATRMPPIISGGFHIGPVFVLYQHIIILFSLLLCSFILQVMFRGRVGRAMRAAAERPYVAGLLGIRARRMTTYSFGIAGMLSALAGILVSPSTYLQPYGGASLGLISVVAAIAGGLGNIAGAVVGGLAIGIVYNFLALAFGGALAESATFIALIVALLIRPEGLFGEEGTRSRS